MIILPQAHDAQFSTTRNTMTTVLSLAPIRGITDRIYRDTFAQFFNGFDYAVAPFVAASRGDNVGRKLLRELADPKKGMPTVPQILSNDPDDFIPIANALHDMGHETVNWNLGCPFPKVVNKSKGAGLLCYPAKIESMLEKIIEGSRCRISVKLRLGYEDIDDITHLVPILNRFPLDEVIIHPRTGVQQYSGECNHDAFLASAGDLSHTVVYNGDITSVAEFENLAKKFPAVSRWMIGRGALADPFLPDEIKGSAVKSREEKLKILRKFHDALYEQYDDAMESSSHLMDRMKGEWEYFSVMFDRPDKIHKKIRKINHPVKYSKEVNSIFDAALTNA